jgi:uncharacterized protein (DUF2461 family)
VYRAAEAEWKAFIEAFTHTLIEADPQVPSLPPKDVIHRIYRDVRVSYFSARLSSLTRDVTQMRFSNDKTPYKKNLSASFSRSGRKGIFAGCMSFSGIHLFFPFCSACFIDHVCVAASTASILR